MRIDLTTGRRGAVVVALLLLALFVLHPACPPEPAHHAASVPGISHDLHDFAAELCHHGETHHELTAAPAQAVVQTSEFSLADLDTDVVAAARPDVVHQSCQWRSEPSRSGRALLLGIGISRT